MEETSMLSVTELLSFVETRLVGTSPNIYDVAEQIDCQSHCAVLSFASATFCAREFSLAIGDAPPDIPHIEVFRSWYRSEGSGKSSVHVFPVFFDGRGAALYFDLTYGQFDTHYTRKLRSMIMPCRNREDFWSAMSVLHLGPVDMRALALQANDSEEEVERAFSRSYAIGDPYRSDVSHYLAFILDNYKPAA